MKINKQRCHIIIPDTQVKPDVNTDHLEHIGKYILDHKPEVIIHIGDHFDMPSLSSYDKGKKSFEGRRYKEDIKAGIAGMEKLLGPIKAYNKHAAEQHNIRYKPEMHFCLGNHEQRIERATEASAELDGVLSYADLKLESFGWKVHPFLKMFEVDGILYSHYIQSQMSDRPLSNAKAIANAVHKSCIVGHAQTLEYHYVAPRMDGMPPIQTVIAGACYTHREIYKGEQGNNHWRGIIRLSGVKNGDFSFMAIPLSYLKDRYESN